MGAVYWFQARQQDPQTGQQLAAPQAGAVESITLFHPSNRAVMLQWAEQQHIGTPGVRYHISELPVRGSFPQPVIMAVQIAYGNGQSPSAQGQAVSAQHVQGAQPTNEPHGQPGQNRPGGERDPRSRFQPISDADLPPQRDSMFGEVDMNNYTDMVTGAGGLEERPMQ